MDEPPSAYAHELLHAFGVPDLYYTGGLIPQAYVDYCKETGSQDIMYTINGDMDRITGQLTELDAYYLGLTARPAEADRWRWASASTRGMMLPAIPSMARINKRSGRREPSASFVMTCSGGRPAAPCP